MNSETTITLISKQKFAKNDIAEAIYSDTKRDVFCVKKSVRQSEFFQAAAVGFRPEIVVEVYSFEYKNEEYCIFEGQMFKIYRAYPIAKTERTELYLTAIVGETNVTA